MLKSLELFGFKSFADRTIFDFAAGITGVVGPNGSGKSNVVDSIKWILGDQSAKSLRGKDMTDVIFNGSASRTGSQFAEATLVFDNRSRFIPVEMDEVSVGRRIWQSGDSEYLVNRNTARLKDVRELFVGTGAGAATYCIIEQGRVDQILQSNAANRRLIFEEAAGISRFKQKRTEALKRLERVETNLVRLSDLVDEVETQVSTVRTQAQRATRYRAVSTELEQLWVGLAADDFRRESNVRDVLVGQMEESAGVVQDLRSRQVAAESEVSAADAALSEVDDQLREVERRRSDLRSRIASLETTVRHQAARETELHSDLQRLVRQQNLMKNRVAEAQAEETHLESVLSLERAAFERRRAMLLSGDDQAGGIQQVLAESRDNIEAARHQLMQQVRINSEAASALSNLRTKHQAAAQKRQQLEIQAGELDAEIQKLNDELPAIEQSMLQAQQELVAVENNADNLIRSREQLVTEQNQSQKSLAELRENRSAQIARRAVLEDLEDRQEGFGIGVREILRRAEEADSEPWNLICGSVADLLDVDMEHAALLEVALSGRAQLLIVTRLKPLIDYLNSGRCRITDRVGFISIEHTDEANRDLQQLRGSLRRDDDDVWATKDSDSETAQQADSWWGRKKPGRSDGDSIERMLAAAGSSESLQVTWVDPRTESAVVRSVFSQGDKAPPLLFGQKGIIGRADGLARPPQSMPGLASHLLADTWVVETLADALRLHAATGGQCRFVTLQGELIENDGTLFAGTVRNESALLSRKSELRRLRNELHRLEHEIAQRELSLRSLGQNISTTDERLNTTRAQVSQSSARCRETEKTLSEHRRVMKESQRQSDLLTVQQQKLSDEITELLSRIDEAEQQHQSGEDLLQQRQQLIAEMTTQLAERQHELEAIERDRTAASLELTRSEERLLGLQEAVERVREDLEQRQLQQQEADRRLQSAAERQRDLLIARLNSSAEIAELSVSDERLATEVHLRASTRNRLRANRNAATAAETQLRETLRLHESRHHEVELQVRGIDHQLSTTADRIREEFQLEVREAVAHGRSAIAFWLQRQNSETSESESESESESVLKMSTGSASAPVLFDEAAQAIVADTDQYTEMRTEIDRRVERLRRQLKKLGNSGSESLDNLIELETRFQRLHMQLTDLESARDTLRDIVRRINVESKRMFVESFEIIRGYFRELFRKLFGGGEADLILEDPEDVLECSIDVVARPPGKELRSISLLSGGEKTLTAVALLLSIFRSRTSPFCILDEVDAALDDANIGRFVNVLREFQQNTQFIMITHRKPTMAVTDVLYGVTMEESGISRRLSLRFEDVDEHGNFIAAAKKGRAA